MNEKLKEKVKESLSSVLPITLIVLVLSVTLVPMEIGTLALFLTGTGAADLRGFEGVGIDGEQAAEHIRHDDGAVGGDAHRRSDRAVRADVALERAEGVDVAGVEVDDGEAAVGQVDRVHTAGVVVKAHVAQLDAEGVAHELGSAEGGLLGRCALVDLALIEHGGFADGVIAVVTRLDGDEVDIAVVVSAASATAAATAGPTRLSNALGMM